MQRLTLRFTLLAALALVSVLALAQSAGNWYSQLIASTVETATTVNTPDQTNANWRGLQLIVNVTAYTSGTYTPVIQAKDPVSGVYYSLLTGPVINSTGTTVMVIYPGANPVTNLVAANVLPRTWRVQLQGASTPSMTLSVGALLEH